VGKGKREKGEKERKEEKRGDAPRSTAIPFSIDKSLPTARGEKKRKEREDLSQPKQRIIIKIYISYISEGGGGKKKKKKKGGKGGGEGGLSLEPVICLPLIPWRRRRGKVKEGEKER